MTGSATPLKIAMIGQRGIPATFGGIERHVEELSSRLAARGHDVTVYCRNNYAVDRRPAHRGVRLRYLATARTKHLDAIVHSGLSTISAVRDDYDVLHYHALGPGLLAPVPRYLTRARVVLTVHGMDNERAKWSTFGRQVLTFGAWVAARVPHATITVSRALAELFIERYGRRAIHIPNGVTPGTARTADEILQRYGLVPGSYVLFVGRFVPEKAPDLLIRAFEHVSGDLRLVLVGGSSYTDTYTASLRAQAERDARVLLPGYVYGPVLEELYANAAAFVLPSFLEGLPLTLLEAASHATPIVASSIAPHVEVLRVDGPGHRLFRPGHVADLTAALTETLHDADGARRGAKELRDDVLGRYSWDRVARATEAVYERVLGIAGADDPETDHNAPGRSHFKHGGSALGG